MRATLANGSLTVPYAGPEPATIELGVGVRWYPAYLDYDERGQRVAMIRPPAPLREPVDVKLRLNGTEHT